MASDATLTRLLSLHPKLVDLSLGRVERLLAALDHPERKLPPVVHVTGTNGKGSVVAFLRAMLEAAGYSVHVYTSPHLVRFHERIRLAGKLIEEAHLDEILQRCEAANAGEAITYFEITTVAALLAFAEKPADIVLLENGLGGRLDATNVVAKPALTAITPVSLDHQQFLGDTLAKIAFEKAGIIKTGVACVTAAQEREALAVIAEKTASVGASLIAHGDGWDFNEVPALGFEVRDGAATLMMPPPNLLGPHQIANAAMAVVMARHLVGFDIPEKALRAGVIGADWPARLQRLTQGPVLDLVPSDWEVWLDGGHNPSAGEAVAAHATMHWADRPLYLIAGMIDSKEPTGFFRPLAPLAAATTAVTIPDEKASVDKETLAALAAATGHRVDVADSVEAAAMAHAARRTKSSGPARVLICGSLYLAGHVLSTHG